MDDLAIIIDSEIEIFADWVAEKGYSKRKYTHPSKVGKWYSEVQETGYLTTKELVQEFEKWRTKNEGQLQKR